MGRKNRAWSEGCIYHVMQRGVLRSQIFKDDEDKRQFLAYLKDRLIKHHVKLHAYCIMTNHYHLLVETTDVPLWKFMGPLNHDYAMFYNRRHEKSGHAYDKRYVSKLVEKTEYFLQVSRYIHNNPTTAGLVKSPQDYPWSSYKAIMNKVEDDIVTIHKTLGYFYGKSVREFRGYMENSGEMFAVNDENIRIEMREKSGAEDE